MAYQTETIPVVEERSDPRIILCDAAWSERLRQLRPEEIRDITTAFQNGQVPLRPAPLCVLVLEADFLRARLREIQEWSLGRQATVKIILIGATGPAASAARLELPPDVVHLGLPAGVDAELVAGVVDNAFANLVLACDKKDLQKRLELTTYDIQRLTRVGQALSTERDFDRLIGLILRSACELVDADSGSIYVAERKQGAEPATHLRFKKSALNLGADEFLLPIDRNSIAGYVALTGAPLRIDDVYELTGKEEYSFNFEFDRHHQYYSRSMMVVPMKNHRGDVIGVIQLINRKADFNETLTLERMRGEGVLPFEPGDQELVAAMAGQAAVAIENNLLLSDINNLFEGFVTAAVTAIEQRDPTTSGHSFRVADLTVGLCQAVDHLSSGKFAPVRFSRDQFRELRYASLLHDFGKVGVREQVLVKSKKLYGHELELIRWRFRYIQKSLQKEYLEKIHNYLKENGRGGGFEEYETMMSREMASKRARIEAMFAAILDANEPAVMEEGNFQILDRISRNKIRLESGEEIPFLKDNELVSLSIRRGNLNQQERLEIESHVTHTYRFLIQIPWTADLRKVPDIARGHHEKLDGSGYPHGLEEQEIPLQTRMMTISDIFDALTAPDRPYKRSLGITQALDILQLEAQANHLDAELLQIFIEARIFDQIKNPNRRDSVQLDL